MMLLYNVCLPLEVFKKISKCLGGAIFVQLLLLFFFLIIRALVLYCSVLRFFRWILF